MFRCILLLSFICSASTKCKFSFRLDLKSLRCEIVNHKNNYKLITKFDYEMQSKMNGQFKKSISKRNHIKSMQTETLSSKKDNCIDDIVMKLNLPGDSNILKNEKQITFTRKSDKLPNEFDIANTNYADPQYKGKVKQILYNNIVNKLVLNVPVDCSHESILKNDPQISYNYDFNYENLKAKLLITINYQSNVENSSLYTPNKNDTSTSSDNLIASNKPTCFPENKGDKINKFAIKLIFSGNQDDLVSEYSDFIDADNQINLQTLVFYIQTEEKEKINSSDKNSVNCSNRTSGSYILNHRLNTDDTKKFVPVGNFTDEHIESKVNQYKNYDIENLKELLKQLKNDKREYTIEVTYDNNQNVQEDSKEDEEIKKIFNLLENIRLGRESNDNQSKAINNII